MTYYVFASGANFTISVNYRTVVQTGKNPEKIAVFRDPYFLKGYTLGYLEWIELTKEFFSPVDFCKLRSPYALF